MLSVQQKGKRVLLRTKDIRLSFYKRMQLLLNGCSLDIEFSRSHEQEFHNSDMHQKWKEPHLLNIHNRVEIASPIAILNPGDGDRRYDRGSSHWDAAAYIEAVLYGTLPMRIEYIAIYSWKIGKSFLLRVPGGCTG